MAEQNQGVPGKEELFSYLVSTFYSSAWMQMGKMANPMTNKVEKDMQQAQFTIDLLDMLEEKTEGNLNDEESKLLTRAIKELKMNYMEEKKKEAEEGKKEDAGSSQEQESASASGEGQQTGNIITPDDTMSEKKKDDDDPGKKSNLWTP